MLTTPWWDKRAVEMQRVVIESDAKDKELTVKGMPEADVSWFEARKAVLHTRHDMVLLYSVLSSANSQLQTIKRLLILITLILLWLAIDRG